MNSKIKKGLLAICPLIVALALTACNGGNGSGVTANELNSIYKNDRDDDGVVDTVYYYSYDINVNEIKLEIDSDNDGVINQVYCYNLGKDKRNTSY